ncbi:hypothetical protein [Streptomyces scabiei]|uniref:hypothetical protein n=1 Tax=Streptomyces scabiei TaxID=1930 RepID=UPI001B32F69A|nr:MULTISPECIES: hypothetical protein [Streptomyces]MDX2684101.1 hypothetical protein [Streptomyces scabiei]MDX2748900.1 hypothetical protein [Streptomyces scabiei]MDX2803089.1 hypothetical protein [Streptomyces scabiei]MDX3120280.1 hypothetical protein [Streptomyces scabiei]MDX3197560.1 hypothetical protein [Streptomyces scabiei]
MKKNQINALRITLYCVLAGVLFGAANSLVTVLGLVLMVIILVLERVAKKKEG